MTQWPAIAASTIFISVFALIISEKTHLMIAGLLGALLLVLLNVMSLQEAIAYISRSHATLALFFGVMVMVRVFQPTRIFEYLATQIVILAKGQCKRLLLSIVAITTPISPATIALLGATLCLLLSHHSKTDSVSNILFAVRPCTVSDFGLAACEG
jgi:Na+/H+ antiporter NhaD/arsenite permease-like protein